MPAYCTCGSPLPDGASFCPRCGRPLSDDVGQPVEASIPPAPAPIEIERPGLEAYVRAAFVPALCAMLARLAMGMLSPLLGALSYAVAAGAGFVTVQRFERQHAAVSGSWHGFGIGALTGLLCFVPSIVLLGAALATQGRDAILAPIREQAESLPMGGEVSRLIEDPSVFAMVMALGLLVEAGLLAISAGVGGAVAAARSRPAAADRFQ